MKSKSSPPRRPTKSRKRKADDPSQYERFREFAREHQADDSAEEFDSHFRKISGKRSPL
jgi:hypothetical protein